jgi:hypothetical protein
MEQLPATPPTASADGVHGLQHVAMLEWLEHDPRPTFILDESSINKGLPVYHNQALKTISSGHVLAVIKDHHLKVTSPQHQQALSEFRKWLITQEGTSRFCTYDSYIWTKAPLASRWAVIFGAPIDASRPIAAAQPEGAVLSKRISRSKAPTFDWTDELPPLRTSSHVAWARAIDWSQTALGPMSAWSSQLRSIANLVMQDPRPAVVFCGLDLIMIYNEPYIELLGAFHPCMGASARVALSDIWAKYFEPIIFKNLAGETVELTDTSVHMVRNGFMEETYFSLKFIPIFDSDGATVAHYEPLAETVSHLLFHCPLLPRQAQRYLPFPSIYPSTLIGDGSAGGISSFYRASRREIHRACVSVACPALVISLHLPI